MENAIGDEIEKDLNKQTLVSVDLQGFVYLFSAEREGFEPPVPRGTTVFKTAAIDHSAISP